MKWLDKSSGKHLKLIAKLRNELTVEIMIKYIMLEGTNTQK